MVTDETLPSANDGTTAAFDRRARVMFFAALAFLVTLAAIIPHGATSDAISEALLSSSIVLGLFFGLWTLILVEGIAGWFTAEDGRKAATRRLALVAAIPAFRMTISPARPNDAVWLPKLGWLAVCRPAVMEMERRLIKPMIAVTILIIPIIAADLLLATRPHDLLENRLAEVTDTAVSRKGARLFLLDDRNRTVATLERPSEQTAQGISDTWTLPDDDDTPTRLTIDAENDALTLETGCKRTVGEIEEEGFTALQRVASCPPTPLEIGLYLVTSFIWFAFAAEFILLVSLAEKKIDFCKRHWINIVIILLPLLAFLRSFQIFRFLRLVQSGKLVRAYRLRGIVTRIARLAIAFNLADRVRARNADKFASHLHEQIAEKEEELAELRKKLDETCTGPGQTP